MKWYALCSLLYQESQLTSSVLSFQSPHWCRYAYAYAMHTDRFVKFCRIHVKLSGGGVQSNTNTAFVLAWDGACNRFSIEILRESGHGPVTREVLTFINLCSEWEVREYQIELQLCCVVTMWHITTNTTPPQCTHSIHQFDKLREIWRVMLGYLILIFCF